MRTARIITGVFLLPLLLWSAELKIAATTDLHGNLEGLAKLAPALRALGPEALRLDAGDLNGGNFHCEYSRGKYMIEALNLLHFDARVPGNHDFEVEYPVFHEQFKDFRGKTLGRDWSWHGTAGSGAILLTKNQIRCAVIGLTEPRMGRRLFADSGAIFEDSRTALKRELSFIRSSFGRVDLIILLWHNAPDLPGIGVADTLKDFPEIDIVIAGHSHEECAGRKLSPAWMVQPGSHGRSAAVITVKLDDRTRKIQSITSCLVSGTVPDRKINRLAMLRRSNLKAMAERIIAPSPQIFRTAVFGPAGARALLRASRSEAALFSFRPPSILPPRADFAALYKLLPYRNHLCTVNVSRREFLALMEEQKMLRKKYGREFSLAGGEHARKERINLTLSDYTLLSSRALRHLREEKTPRWKILPVLERDAVFQQITEKFQ